ncbi:MAG: DUF1707 SHOCT-like domain-containing protein [Streptosporangiaceae bacterium]
MDEAARGYPSGDLRVSDAERDRAIGELSVAFQAGRITAEEFDQRSAQILNARTGKELVVPLADLPIERAPSAALEPARRAPISRIVIGASVAATCSVFIAVANALIQGPTLAQREFAQQMAARQGFHIPLPPAQGFDWVGTIVPGAVAVLLVVLIVVLHVTRARRV